MTKRPLTNVKKKSTIYIEGVYAFFGLKKLKKLITKIPVFLKHNLLSRKETVMKTNVTMLFAALVTAFLLVACGGGGGGSSGGTTPTQPTTVTVNCPNGTTATGATTTDANNACPLPKLLSITPANGDRTVSPDTFTGLTVATDSLLDPTSLTTANIKLMIGSNTNIAGTVSATADGKGFRFVPTAKLFYGQIYDNFTATVMDKLGRLLVVKSAFTTAPVQCFAPNVWDGTNCVAPATWPPATITPVGVKVFGANQLPAGCTSASQQCWKDAVANGTVKFISTPALMTSFNNRPVVFAYFRNTTVAFGVNGLWNYLAFYADDGSLVGSDIYGGTSSEIDWVYGNTSGILVHEKSTGLCIQTAWDAIHQIWNVNGTGTGTPVPCP